jgi:uncharacterized protein
MENDPLISLRAQLEQEEWPAVYLFKFIVPNSPEKLAKAMTLFEEGVEIKLSQSSSGKYVSIGVKELMLDVDSIIQKYIDSKQVEGLIAL